MPTFVRRTDIEAAPMLEETILYSPAAKQFCVLNPTAAFLWERLAEPVSTQSLASALRDAFATDSAANVEADVQGTLQQFQSLEMIQLVGA